MIIKISVTKDVLERSTLCVSGQPYILSDSCGLAQAMRDLFPNASVYITDFSISDEHRCIKLPEAAYQWRELFDRCSTKEQVLALPLFSFEIEVPQEVINSIGISEVYKILSESKSLELVSI